MRHEFQAKMPEVADKIKFYIGDVVVSDHIRDSIRHAVHYMTYNTKYKGGDTNEE